jgi:hypothetical protein
VKVNNGVRDFSTSVTPKQNLCDGRWHRITGEKLGMSPGITYKPEPAQHREAWRVASWKNLDFYMILMDD